MVWRGVTLVVLGRIAAIKLGLCRVNCFCTMTFSKDFVMRIVYLYATHRMYVMSVCSCLVLFCCLCLDRRPLLAVAKPVTDIGCILLSELKVYRIGIYRIFSRLPVLPGPILPYLKTICLVQALSILAFLSDTVLTGEVRLF